MIKPGVDVSGLRPEILLAVMIARPIFAAEGVDLVITSALDGKHMRGSLHYVGLAVDLRTRDLPQSRRDVVAAKIKEALGDQYDVILNRTHLHVEHQPK